VRRKESRKAKALVMEELREKAGRAQIGVLTDFTGLKVEIMTQLRRQVKEADGELRVAKNTLLRQSAEGDSLIAPLTDQFEGPNAVAFGYTDPVALAKLLVKFAQEKPLFKIKAGVMGGQVLSPKDIEALSKLPAREVLLAQLLGAMQAVPTGLVTVLAGVIRGLLNVLVAIKDQKNGGEDASPAEETGIDEA
jgi:large subunit ribosomal protein L10